MKIVSSGFVILNRREEVLLGRVDAHDPPYQYTVFKGQQEKGESLLDTAIRELQEETGIDVLTEHKLNRYISTDYVFTYHMKNKDVYLYSLEDVEGVLDNFECFCSSLWGETQHPEISGYKWVKMKDLYDHLFPSQRGLVKFLQRKYQLKGE